MMEAILPEFLSHNDTNGLVRVGRENDGGYVISESDFEVTDLLIGLGINNDWSFEADFVNRRKVPIIAYDGSISGKSFLKEVIRAIPRIDKPSIAINRLKTFLGYKSFFKNDRQHVQKFVGLSYGENYISMTEIFEDVSPQRIFLKIDIEGSEYRILDDLIANQEWVSGLVIEFHDCDLHLYRIERFVEQISLPLVHVHANNFAPLDGNRLPLVLELSFSSTAKLLDQEASYPRPIDMPNNPLCDEIVLSFAS